MAGKTGNRNVRIIDAPKQLQERVGTGPIDDELVKKAQKVIENNEVDFTPLAKTDIKTLGDAIAQARELDAKELSKLPKDMFSKPIMNLKANAGSFHYELISDISEPVLSALEKSPDINKDILKIIILLHKSIHLVIAEDMEGRGGGDGRELDIAFQELCHNFEKGLPDQ